MRDAGGTIQGLLGLVYGPKQSTAARNGTTSRRPNARNTKRRA